MKFCDIEPGSIIRLCDGLKLKKISGNRMAVLAGVCTNPGFIDNPVKYLGSEIDTYLNGKFIEHHFTKEEAEALQEFEVTCSLPKCVEEQIGAIAETEMRRCALPSVADMFATSGVAINGTILPDSDTEFYLRECGPANDIGAVKGMTRTPRLDKTGEFWYINTMTGAMVSRNYEARRTMCPVFQISPDEEVFESGDNGEYRLERSCPELTAARKINWDELYDLR